MNVSQLFADVQRTLLVTIREMCTSGVLCECLSRLGSLNKSGFLDTTLILVGGKVSFYSKDDSRVKTGMKSSLDSTVPTHKKRLYKFNA